MLRRMTVRSLRSTDGLSWVHERPSLRIGWLVCWNLVRRWPLLGWAAALVLAGCAAVGRSAAVRHGLASAATAPILVAGASALVFATALLRRRSRLSRHRHRDWLAPLPNDLALGVRAASLPAAAWSGAALAIVAAAAGAGLPVSVIESLLSASAAGSLLAAAAISIFSALARLSARSRRDSAFARHVPPPSRYTIVRSPRRAWASHPRLLPLGYWAPAQAKFWNRPKVRARSLVLLLLALPLEVTGAVALAAAAVWLLLLHMANLLLGIVRSAFAASSWLAPTTVGLVRFSVALSHRALLAEVASCALLVGMTYAIGGAAALHRALPPAIAWIAAACAVSAAACVLALQTHQVARSVLHRWMQ